MALAHVPVVMGAEQYPAAAFQVEPRAAAGRLLGSLHLEPADMVPGFDQVGRVHRELRVALWYRPP